MGWKEIFYRSKNPSTVDQERLKIKAQRWTIYELRSFEARLPIVGETRRDALMIAELVLRGHETSEIPADPPTEQPPPPKLAMRRSIVQRAAMTGVPQEEGGCGEIVDDMELISKATDPV
jgi:hypothetical protein